MEPIKLWIRKTTWLMNEHATRQLHILLKTLIFKLLVINYLLNNSTKYTYSDNQKTLE